MGIDLRAVLPQLLPRAIAWAEEQSQIVATTGRALSLVETRLAHAVGVMQPERIRMLEVRELPLPTDPMLRQAAVLSGLLGPDMIGLTLEYSVLIVKGHISPRLLSHEFRHVYQYEAAGSIDAFLPVYLQEVVTVGYFDASFEQDARAHERDA
jgi:hypothetical protein